MLSRDSRRNLWIGIFVLGACGLIVWILLTLHPKVGDQGQTVSAFFSDINKISVGTKVTYAGMPVGEVVAIHPVPDPQNTKADSQGRRYVFDVVMKVDSSVDLYDTDRITIQTSGLLGEKAIALIPQVPPKGMQPAKIDGQKLYADSSDALDSAVRQISELATTMGKTMDTVTDFIQNNEKDFQKALVNFGAAMGEVESALATLDQEEFFKRLPEAVAHLASITEALDRPEDLARIVQRVSDLSDSIAVISSRLEKGEGSLGSLLVKDDVYQELRDLLKQANVVATDITQYGLLFHNNKQWLRSMRDKESCAQPSSARAQ